MKAITVGSATIDVIATVDDADIERMTLHNVTASFLLLEPGRKVDARSVITQTGGGAVNAAVALRRLGYAYHFSFRCPDDRFVVWTFSSPSDRLYRR